MVFDSFGGIDGLSILVIGDDAWSRTGSEPWKKATTKDYPTCGQGGEMNSSTMKRCTFATMSDLTAGLRDAAGTFEVATEREQVNGVDAIHRRATRA